MGGRYSLCRSRRDSDDEETMTYPRIVIVQDPTTPDHFPGVAEALELRGYPSAFLTPASTELINLHTPDVVAVKETQSPLSMWALRRAHDLGARSVLLMDGVLEYRNTFLNPFVGKGFLHPALTHTVACAGPMDEALLRSWGNDAVATGLPRINHAFPAPLPAPEPGSSPAILIATANRPAFTPDERTRLLAALRLVRDALSRRRVPTLWRLTAGLDAELGVSNAPGSLRSCLERASAVLTTPSTLAIEAMVCGRPTGLIHPQPGPLWQRTPWIWRADASQASPVTPSRAEPGPSAQESLDSLLESILAPSQAEIQAQARDLALQHGSMVRPDEPAANCVAELLIEVCNGKRSHRSTTPAIPELSSIPPRLPRLPGKSRVVNCIACDGSPVGGVMTWALRLARSMAVVDSRYDVRTLVVVTRPGNLYGDFDINPDGLTEVCTLDPMSDPTERLETLVESIRRLEPDIVLPNYSDICHMAACRLSHEGVRSIAIAHSDEPYYQELAATYARWSAAVAVSDACLSWLSPLAEAASRPIRKIVYGVPVAKAPRGSSRSGPLRLAYIGRMVEAQKRISNFLLLVDALEARGVSYELHMVGDGHDLSSWAAGLASRNLRHGAVRMHGRRDPAWVERFLQGIDISVLLSEFEGTSVTMLEAMGAGVVPAVTRVRSGVDEWVRDGESGIVVEVGAIDDMADRLTALWRDRESGGDKLVRMGIRAWERVRSELGLDKVAEQYASVFDSARAEPLDPAPSDACLRIVEPWQWLKPWSDSPSLADARCLEALRAAGYRRISSARPGSVEGLPCDAVLIRACDPSPDQEQIDGWRAQGLGVAVSPMLVPTPRESSFHLAVLNAIQRGRRRIAVFGTGRHTRDRHTLFVRERWPTWPFVGFIDDAAPANARMFGLPVVSSDDALRALRPDAVVLSSDLFEDQLWQKSSRFREAGVEVIRLYKPAARPEERPTASTIRAEFDPVAAI